MQRKGVGSSVPVQSNSSRKRDLSGRCALAPWLMVRGRMADCRSRRAWRNAAPLGAQSHLWQLPVYQAAPSSRRFNGSIPGACAASTSVSMPRSSSRRTSSCTGKISPVGLVT